MVEIESGSLEERILKILMVKYPITVTDLQEELDVHPDVLERTLKALQTRGVIMLDILPDATFIRLMNTGIDFIGRKPTQRKSLRSKKGEKKEISKEIKKEEKDIMYR